MVIFLRSIDCNPDPRVQKYVDYLDKSQIHSKIICWDRSDKLEDDERHIYYRRIAGFGGGIQNYKGILGFNKFIFKTLFKHRKSYKVIHACDFDTILPALFFKIFFRKKVIYDIFDWFADGRHFENGMLKSLILFLEKCALRIADATIICDERRAKQINYQPKTLWVLPNIPAIKVENIPIIVSPNKDPNKIYLSYVGTMPSDRGLDKILKCVSENPNVELDIAGFGIMADLAKDYSDKYNNIHFYGTVHYEKGLEIMSKSDIIVATYEKTCRNNIFAAPNKYYEGLFLGKPILTTAGTIVAESTLKYETGFIVGENIEDYSHFLQQPNLKYEAKIYGQNARMLWTSKFKNYVSHFMASTYVPFAQKYGSTTR